MQQKTAFVTGASEGIGRAFAHRLAREGFVVTALARNVERLRTLVEELEGTGHSYISADLGTHRGMDAAANALSAENFSLVVNNAGITHYGAFAELPWALQGEILNINCAALTRIAHAFLSTAKAGDALVNVSSMLSFLPQPTSALYSASKAFVTSLSEALWYEGRVKGVYVVGLHPGVTHTEFRRRGGGAPTRAPWAQTPEQVVEVGMRAVAQRRRCTVVSGPFNRLLAWGSQLVPRQTLVKALGDGRSRKPQREGELSKAVVAVEAAEPQ